MPPDAATMARWPDGRAPSPPLPRLRLRVPDRTLIAVGNGSSYCCPIQFHRRPQLRLLLYLLGAPGVGRSLATCAPLACARVNAAMMVMPVPETCAPAA